MDNCTYILVGTKYGYAMAIRYNHKPVQFTEDLEIAFWAHKESITDDIELKKICNRLNFENIPYNLLYIGRDGEGL